MGYRMINENQKYVVVVDSAREKAYRMLRNRIVNMELSPGTLISTQDVADDLSISRTPVREAFLKLQEEHLLEISPQKPSVVSRIDLKRVQQEWFVREALEVENMRLFVKNPPEGSIRKMGAIIERQKEVLRGRNYELYQELDNEFHILPFYETGQALAATVIAEMNGHYARTRMLIRRNHEISNDIIGEHEALLDSIEKRDSDKAIELLRRHIQAIQPLQNKLIQQWPEYFV